MEMSMQVPLTTMEPGKTGMVMNAASKPDQSESAGGFQQLLVMMLGDESESAPTSASLEVIHLLQQLGIEDPLLLSTLTSQTDASEVLEGLSVLLKQAMQEDGDNAVISAFMALPEVQQWTHQMMATLQAEPLGNQALNVQIVLKTKAQGSYSVADLAQLLQLIRHVADKPMQQSAFSQLLAQFNEKLKPVLESTLIAKHLKPAAPLVSTTLAQLSTALQGMIHQTIRLQNSNDHNVWRSGTLADLTAMTRQAEWKVDSWHTKGHTIDQQMARLPFAHQPLWTTVVQAQGNQAMLDGTIPVQAQDEITLQNAMQISTDKPMVTDVPKPAPTPAPVHVQHFVKEMSDLVFKQLSFHKGDGLTTAKMTLVPEHLGQIAVKLTMQNGQLAAQFVATTAMGKDILEAQLGQLRIALQNQGLQVEKIVVSQQVDTSGFQMNTGGQHSDRQYDQASSRKQQRYEDEGDFIHALDDRLEASRLLRGGSSFEATA